MPPSRPKVIPFHVPVVATSTAPGAVVRELSQQAGTPPVVDGISGEAHHVAVRNGTPPRTEETICHGGTCMAEGLEINSTPLDSTPLTSAVLVDLTPSALTFSWTSEGPPLLTIWGFLVSVTTLALASPSSTVSR